MKYVFENTLADSNLSTVQELTAYTATAPTTKQGFAGLYATASDKGANPYDCVAVLNPATYAALLSSMGDSSPFMPEGKKGFIIPWNTLGVVSRWDKPAIDGYEETWTAIDPKTGFTIGYRVFEHLCKGKAFMGGNVLFGAKVLQPGIITLT